MISKKSSSSKSSSANSEKEIIRTQEELFNLNQKITVKLEETCLLRIDGEKIDSDNCLEALEEITEKKLG